MYRFPPAEENSHNIGTNYLYLWYTVTYKLMIEDRTEPAKQGTETKANGPKRMIFESELWTERPKWK